MENKENNTLSVQDCINDFRVKAKHYMDMAEELNIHLLVDKQDKFNANLKPVSAVPINGNGHKAISAQGKVSVPILKDFMKDKAYRSLNLARQFRVTLNEIENLVTPENGFVRGNIGWLWVKAAQKAVQKAEAKAETTETAVVKTSEPAFAAV